MMAGIDVDTPIEKDMTSHEAFIALKYANVLWIFSRIPFI